MRCGCPECGTYMVHSDDLALGCVCPACAYRCAACMGTNSVLSREDLKRMGELQKMETGRNDDTF